MHQIYTNLNSRDFTQNVKRKIIPWPINHEHMIHVRRLSLFGASKQLTTSLNTSSTEPSAFIYTQQQSHTGGLQNAYHH